MLTSLTAIFASAFLSATLLPGVSEATLLTLAADAHGVWLVVLGATASLGNTLGAVVNWWLGRYCLRWQDRRWFPFSAAQLRRGGDFFRRYGVWSLLLAWLPVVGDPLTFAAGVLRAPLLTFLVLVAVGKTVRYAVLLAGLRAII
jgi:membrane protein YqaA with SNARE-associated domain